MKTPRLLRTGFLLSAIFAFLFSGCKKDETTDPPSTSASVQQLSIDANSVQQSNDEALVDVNGVLSGGGNGGQKGAGYLPCNATIDSANVINDTLIYYITYNGLNCSQTIYRTGQVEIRKAVGTHWIAEGATVIVKYINLKATRVSTGKSVTLNGTVTNQNVTGGIWILLGNGMTSIIHKHWGTVNATFDDNTTSTWNLARQQTYTGSLDDDDELVLAIDGFGTSGTYANLECWGVDRSGADFYISILQSVVHQQECEWDPCSGIKTIALPGEDMGATLTFGYDDDNEPIEPDECPEKYKVDWYIGTNSGTLFLYL